MRQVFLFLKICYLEWHRHRKQYLDGLVTKTGASLDELFRTFGCKPPVDWGRDRGEVIQKLDHRTREILKERKISIVKTPPTELDRLVEMAVNKIRPFEEKGEKGFKDSLILFTVFHHAKGHENHTQLLVTNDEIYKHPDVIRLAGESSVELLTADSLVSAIQELEGWGQHINQIFKEYDEATLKLFLHEQFPKITDFIKNNCEFPLSSLNRNLQLGIFPRVIKVSDPQVAKINSAQRETLPKDGNGKVRISCVLTVKLQVTIHQPQLPPEPRFKMGAEVPSVYETASAGMLGLIGHPNPGLIEEQVTCVDVSIEGDALLKRVQDEKGFFKDSYSELVLERAII